jgi:hypothetical protein
MGPRSPIRPLRLLRRIAPWGVAMYGALYLGLLVGGPVLDATFTGTAAGGEPHVEAEQSAPCPVHDHDVCQLCRTLRAVSLAGESVSTAASGTSGFSAPHIPGYAPVVQALDPSQSPRAPPIA